MISTYRCTGYVLKFQTYFITNGIVRAQRNPPKCGNWMESDLPRHMGNILPIPSSFSFVGQRYVYLFYGVIGSMGASSLKGSQSQEGMWERKKRTAEESRRLKKLRCGSLEPSPTRLCETRENSAVVFVVVFSCVCVEVFIVLCKLPVYISKMNWVGGVRWVYVWQVSK